MKTAVCSLVADARQYITRLLNSPVECKAVFLVLFCSFISGFLAIPATVISGLYLIFTKSGLKKVFYASNMLVTLLLAYTLVVAAVCRNIFGIAVSLFLFFAFVIIFCVRDKMNLTMFEDIITAFIGYSVFAGIYALIEWPLGTMGYDRYRCAATFVNPLYYCYFLSFVVLFCIYRIVTRRNAIKVYLPVLALNLLGLLLSGSKMPWIGLVCGAMLTLIMYRKWKWICIMLAAIGVGAVAVALFTFANPDRTVWEIFKMNSITDSIDDHKTYWEAALGGILDNPIFGRGFFGVFNDTYKPAAAQGKVFDLFNWMSMSRTLRAAGVKIHAHNIVFEALYSMGIIGVVTGALCLIRRFFNMLRSCKFDTRNPLIILVTGCFVFIGVDGIVDCQMLGGQTAVFTLMLLTVTSVFGESRNYRVGAVRSEPNEKNKRL